MEWTIERPARSGFYWIAFGMSEPTLAEIAPGHDGQHEVELIGSDIAMRLDSDRFDRVRWCGPIEPPSMGKPHAVNVKYPAHDGVMQTVTVYAQGYDAQRAEIISGLTCYGATTEAQARRAGELHLAVNRE